MVRMSTFRRIASKSSRMLNTLEQVDMGSSSGDALMTSSGGGESNERLMVETSFPSRPAVSLSAVDVVFSEKNLRRFFRIMASRGTGRFLLNLREGAEAIGRRKVK